MEGSNVYGLLTRSSEYIVGRAKGRIKSHAIKRMNQVEAWDHEFAVKVSVNPWELVSGKSGHKLPSYIKDGGELVVEDNKQDGENNDEEDEPPYIIEGEIPTLGLPSHEAAYRSVKAPKSGIDRFGMT